MQLTRLSFPILVSVLLLLALGPAAFAAESSGFELPVRAGEKRLAEVQSLPLFKAYDSQGRRIFAQDGMPSTFRQELDRLITATPASAPELTLTDELAAFVHEDGSVVGIKALPKADFTFVKYWAGWCAPCHQQSKIVKDVIAAHPDVKINVVLVEADASKEIAENPAGVECSEALCPR